MLPEAAGEFFTKLGEVGRYYDDIHGDRSELHLRCSGGLWIAKWGRCCTSSASPCAALEKLYDRMRNALIAYEHKRLVSVRESRVPQ